MGAGGIVSAGSAHARPAQAGTASRRPAASVAIFMALLYTRDANRPTEARMADISAFPVAAKWPPAHPERLQYYGLPTPNGVKVTIMLEETGLPYEAHKVDFSTNAQKSPE